MATIYTLGKEERLKSKLTIQGLLENGRTASSFPLKIYWDISPDRFQKYPARVAISVPKRKIKKAVDRNLMKRRIRESYRMNKDLIYDPLREKGIKIVMIVMYLSDEFVSYDNLNTGLRELLSKLAVNLV
jgi:ribonuclease P protein component